LAGKKEEHMTSEGPVITPEILEHTLRNITLPRKFSEISEALERASTVSFPNTARYKTDLAISSMGSELFSGMSVEDFLAAMAIASTRFGGDRLRPIYENMKSFQFASKGEFLFALRAEVVSHYALIIEERLRQCAK
jgi:hypothetical protein